MKTKRQRQHLHDVITRHNLWARVRVRVRLGNLASPLISGTGKATDFKFGRYIYGANPSKSPFKS